jgi:hypothetical protein
MGLRCGGDLMEWLLFIVAVLLLAGLAIRIGDRAALRKRRAFAQTYLERLSHLVRKLDAGKFDGATFDWLTMNVPQMQRALGYHGVMAYRAPFGIYSAQRYQILINTLPQIRSGIAHPSDIQACQDAILRYIGELNEEADGAESLLNPLAWLREGVRFVVTLPLRLAVWSGLMSESTFVRASNHPLTRIVSALAWTVGLVASVIEIAEYWDELRLLLGVR